MALLQSLGDGTFAANVIALTGNEPVDVLLADTSDDGVPDIMLANAGSGTVSFFSFMGGLGGEVEYGTMNVASPMGLSFGQYNQNTDAVEDVFAFGGSAFAALPGDGQGISDAPVGGTIGTDLRRAVGGDLGGSSAGDAAVADFAEGGIYVLLGDGDPVGFTAQDFYATGAGAIDVAAGDVTGDGDVDLAVANSGDDSVTVLEKTS
ncbi:MAG: hypothetical protein KDK70_43360, partial [Myxococcales bacterium]|nr:hypothetical protein [Myxococcales bacterium]